MNGLMQRVLASFFTVALGGLAGYLVGAPLRAPLFGLLLGAAAAAGVAATLDSLRTYRLIKWLRGAQDKPVPRDAGMWGELGYRLERAIGQRERELSVERTRLSQFLSAIEASPNGVMLLDGTDQIEWCNSVAADHFGLDPQRDRRQRVTNLVRTPAFVACLQAGTFGEAVSVPDRLGKGLLSVLIRRYGDDMKLVLSQDITERERAEAMRRDFVANVSHEIRTPLTVLSGFLETSLNLDLSETERRRVLTLMTQQAQRMQTLVNDLLILAQLEGSPRPASDRWVPLGHLLQQVHADAQALSGGRHALTLAENCDYQIAGVEAELSSALGNLVSNAIRYTPSGGSVDLSWRVLADGCGELAVSDSGPGIAREHLPRLTERFYRVDGSRSRDTGGTGLGLSIVKHVMQRHGGELLVQSQEGKGSRFSLVFPAVRLRASVHPTDTEQTPPQQGDARH